MTTHLRHSIDGYPLCWPQDRDGDHTSSPDEHAVDCGDCLTILNDGEDPR